MIKRGLAGHEGLTLTEVLIATVLLTVVVMGAAALYLAAARFLNTSIAAVPQTDSYLAMERMARRIGLADEIRVTTADGTGTKLAIGAAGQQFKMRWDYQVNGSPNPTTGPQIGSSDPTDDTWVKYRFTGGKLVWDAPACCNGGTNPNAEPGDVAPGDPEVQTGLAVITDTGAANFSTFTKTADNVVHIKLVTNVGNPPKQIILERDVTANATSV